MPMSNCSSSINLESLHSPTMHLGHLFLAYGSRELCCKLPYSGSIRVQGAPRDSSHATPPNPKKAISIPPDVLKGEVLLHLIQPLITMPSYVSITIIPNLRCTHRYIWHLNPTSAENIIKEQQFRNSRLRS